MGHYDNFMKDKADQDDGLISVIVNGNRDRAKYGIPLIKTHEKELSLNKCQEICQKIEAQYGLKVTDLHFLMTKFNYSVIKNEHDALGALLGDFGLPVICDKSARYYASSNTLTIYKDDMPIYENANGQICRDSVALCDTLFD